MHAIGTYATNFLVTDLMKAARGQKHTSESKNKHEKVDFLKKLLNDLKIPLIGLNQI